MIPPLTPVTVKARDDRVGHLGLAQAIHDGRALVTFVHKDATGRSARWYPLDELDVLANPLELTDHGADTLRDRALSLYESLPADSTEKALALQVLLLSLSPHL